MTEQVLFVDDDENLLAGYRRALRKLFSAHFAKGGQEGLEILGKDGPFAVVVSDMQMPGMNGIEFLAKVNVQSPDTVRMMLTGNADLNTAMGAVNEGRIFRFLTKPCSQETLSAALQGGIEQYRLITSERELLERTLRGSVKVLTEILSLVNPSAFSRATRVRRYVKHIVTEMDLRNAWRFEIAAMLSQVGCVALPPDLLDKTAAGAELSPDEQKMFASHPTVGADLLANIPRLEQVSRMILGQQTGAVEGRVPAAQADEKNETLLGAQILKAALDLDQLLTRGLSLNSAIGELQRQPQRHNGRVLDALKTLGMEQGPTVTKMVTVPDLTTNMIADEDVKAKNGLLLLPRGQEVTYTVLARLRNFSGGVGVNEPFRVRTTPNAWEQ